MKILVTGGLGFIGSHAVVELLNDGYEVVVIDNLSNSSLDVIDKIKEITKKDFDFYQNDVCDLDALEEIFSKNKIEAVIHFAGYKAVGESVREPIMYYENNLVSTLHLCKKMIEHDLSRSEVEHLIDEWIFSERDRNILKRRLLDGIIFDQLSEEFEMSVRQIKKIVYKGQEKIFRHI